jgi:hypothetical protein
LICITCCISCGSDLANGSKRSANNDDATPTKPANPLKNLRAEFKKLDPCQIRSCQREKINSEELAQMWEQVAENFKNDKSHIDKDYVINKIFLRQYNSFFDEQDKGIIKFKNYCYFGTDSETRLTTSVLEDQIQKSTYLEKVLSSKNFEKNNFCNTRFNEIKYEPSNYTIKMKLDDDFFTTYLRKKFNISQSKREISKVSIDGESYLEVKIIEKAPESTFCLYHYDVNKCFYSLKNITKELVILLSLNNTIPMPSVFYLSFFVSQNENLLSFEYQMYQE